MDDDAMVTVQVTVMRDGRVNASVRPHDDCAPEAVLLLAAGAMVEAQRILLASRKMNRPPKAKRAPPKAE